MKTLLRTALAVSTFLACSSCTKQQQAQLQTAIDYSDVACAVIDGSVNNPVVDFLCNVVDRVDNKPKTVTMHVARPVAVRLGLVRPATVPSSAASSAASAAPGDY